MRAQMLSYEKVTLKNIKLFLSLETAPKQRFRMPTSNLLRGDEIVMRYVCEEINNELQKHNDC